MVHMWCTLKGAASAKKIMSISATGIYIALVDKLFFADEMGQ